MGGFGNLTILAAFSMARFAFTIAESRLEAMPVLCLPFNWMTHFHCFGSVVRRARYSIPLCSITRTPQCFQKKPKHAPYDHNASSGWFRTCRHLPIAIILPFSAGRNL